MAGGDALGKYIIAEYISDGVLWGVPGENDRIKMVAMGMRSKYPGGRRSLEGAGCQKLQILAGLVIVKDQKARGCFYAVAAVKKIRYICLRHRGTTPLQW